jgi:NAD(P)-dependent dehydrogenase (short-subunit alcohol dehydrogenase family)
MTALLTGGASGLGLATARRLAAAGAHVVIADLSGSDGAAIAAELDGVFVPADVTDPAQVAAAVGVAVGGPAPLRAVVHTAGRGRPQRIVTKEGAPGDLGAFEDIIDVNLIGTYNVLRIAAAAIAETEPIDGERGVVIMTSSVAAFEGQIGQIAYAASKAAIAGMTICAARDLARRQIRVNTIAPGVFDTPLMNRAPEHVRESLGASIPHPRRMGDPDEYATLAVHIVENPYLNGATIRLDGAVRMAPV